MLMGKFPVIKNRKEMREELQKSLLSIRDIDENEDKPERKFKTFLIESNVNNPTELNDSTARIISTDDKSLNIVEINNKYFYFDSFDQRFWLVHTFEHSDEASKILKNFINTENNKLDFVWFSSEILDNIYKKGKPTGFGLKFKNKFIHDEDIDDDKLQQISMKFWGGHSLDLIKQLNEYEHIKDGIRLSNIGLKYQSIKEDINYYGKFTIRSGEQINDHFILVDLAKNKYSEIINKIENDYRILFKDSASGIKLSGNPLIIDFPKELENIKLFIDIIFSGNNPFRLLGIKNKLQEDYYKVHAIDIHTFHKVNFEITNNFIRIYLKDGSCGNVITRFYTNLQQYFNSNIKLWGVDNDRIF